MLHPRVFCLILTVRVVSFDGVASACVGDLDGDARVGVAELVRCLGSFLGAKSDLACDDAYPDLSVSSLIRGVRNLLDGCPLPTLTGTSLPLPTPTTQPTSNASSTATATPRPTSTPSPTPAAPTDTPTAVGTSTSTPTATRTATRTSCVSDPPTIYSAMPFQESRGLVWHVTGWSRILLHGRGGVTALLGCDRVPVRNNPTGSQSFDLDVTLRQPGSNLLSVCTVPAMCGTAYCSRRRFECSAGTCIDLGNLSPLPRRDLACP